ncbi:MAG: DNA-processing protein DprA [Candidatus Pacebacteria bacterium]|nr:DNA-processing protein DprA [Candidatus Paceibacterota bacterium]
MPTDDIVILQRGDASYPELLAQIADPPEQLYIRGNQALLDSFCFAVVGTRKASDYGLHVTDEMVGALATNGLTIVSGLAMGIDAAAHRATLKAKGKTIAVFGTGVDDASIYPSDHVKLAHEILHHDGLLVSEYPPGTHGQVFTFPARNRIISGLSRGVLVVEADRKSGSLITANCALDQNRDVFAVPGSIYWPRSIGSNLLIQQGARPVLNATDILESYKLRQVALPEQVLSTSDPVQECILALLREHGPLHTEELATRSGTSISLVLSALTLLELRDIIHHQGSGIYKLLSHTP